MLTVTSQPHTDAVGDPYLGGQSTTWWATSTYSTDTAFHVSDGDQGFIANDGHTFREHYQRPAL